MLQVEKINLHVNKNDVTREKNDVTREQKDMHVNKKCFSWRVLLSKHDHYIPNLNNDPSDPRFPSAIKPNVTSVRIS
jgi:hypothetical protein